MSLLLLSSFVNRRTATALLYSSCWFFTTTGIMVPAAAATATATAAAYIPLTANSDAQKQQHPSHNLGGGLSWSSSPSSSSSPPRSSRRRFGTTTATSLWATKTTAVTPPPSSSTTTTIKNKNTQVICQNMLYRIREVNKPIPDDVVWMPFIVDGELVGKVTEYWVNLLIGGGGSGDDSEQSKQQQQQPNQQSIFQVVRSSSSLSCSSDNDHDDESLGPDAYLTFNDDIVGCTSFEKRTSAVSDVMNELRTKGHINGWRDELYPIGSSFYDDPPKFLMERAAVPILGGQEYGVHINGLVVRCDDDSGNGNGTSGGGDVKMWMARRSSTKSKYPGMVDHIVAGGIPYGISLKENVVKECMEEAGIRPELVQSPGRLKSTGVISYESFVESKQVISRAVLFNYDLLLPQDFVPTPVDGEVEEFFLWDIDQIFDSFDPSYDDPIKPNCYPVIIDYLVREGHIDGDTPGYLDIIRELRSGQCM